MQSILCWYGKIMAEPRSVVEQGTLEASDANDMALWLQLVLNDYYTEKS